MATKWTSPVWRMPENSNQSKLDNYSLDFDGTNYVTTPTTIVGTLDSRSVSFWFKTSSISSFKCLAKFDTTTGAGRIKVFLLSSQLHANGVGSNGVTNAWSNKTSTLSNDTWYHICIISSPNTPEGKIYVNGVNDTNSGGSNVSADPDGFSYIGKTKNSSGNGGPFNGQIGQTAIFDYALSETQVKYLYNNNDAVNPTAANPQNPMAIAGPTPIAYYPLGGSSTGSSSTLTIPSESDNGDTVFDFEGPNANEQYIDTPFAPNGYTKFTVSQWLNTPLFRARSALFATHGNSGTDFQASFESSGNGYLYIWVGGAYALSVNQLFNLGLQNKWFHLTLVYDGTFTHADTATQNAERLKMYINGSYVAFNHGGSGTIPSSIPTGNTGMYIGSTSPTTYEYGGKMSNVQMWDTSLSATEITALYNGGRPYTGTQPQAANLKGWWKMNVDTSFYLTPEPSQTQNLYEAWFLENKAYPASIDKCLVFGQNSEIRYDSLYLSNEPEITYSMWWMNESSVNSADLMFGNRHATYYNVRVIQNRSSAPTVYAGLKTNDGAGGYNTYTVYVGNIISPTPGFSLLTFTYNGSTWKAYLNDTEVDSVSATGTLWDVSSGGINGEVVVRDTSGSAVGMRGSNFIIWNKGLTASEVSTLYNSGTPLLTKSSIPQDSSMLLWNTLENTTQTSGGGLYDKSGNSVAVKSVTSDISVSDVPVSTWNGISSGMTTANLVTSDLNRSLLYSSYSMDFDGTDYMETVAVPPAITQVSLSAWIKRDGAQSNYNGVLGVRNSGGANVGHGVSWDFAFHQNNNKISFRVGNGADYFSVFSNDIIPDNTWTHVLGVLKGTDVFIYINGVKQTETETFTGTLYPPQSTNGEINIGKQGSYNNFYFNGKISNPAVFDRGLSENEILTIYNGGAPSDISSLSPINWWSLSGDSYYDGSKWVSPDLGSNSNNTESTNLPVTALVGNAPGSTANGTGTSMAIPTNLQGNAPNSDKNAYSVNMIATNRGTSVPSVP